MPKEETQYVKDLKKLVNEEDTKKIDNFVTLIDWTMKVDIKKIKQLSPKKKAAGRKVVNEYLEVVERYFTGG